MALSFPDTQASRRMGMRFVLLLGVPLLALVVAEWIVAQRTSTVGAIGLAVVAAIIGVSILSDWRFGVFLFIGWLLFEDLARKYMGNNMYVYFGKDVLVGVTYVSFLFATRHGKTRFFRPPFLLPLSLFFWLGIMQVFNPNSPSIWYGLLGTKLYFYYVPLMFIGYALLRSEEDLRRLLVWNLVLAGLISLLGIIQAIIGPDFLNPARLAPEIANLGKLYRYSPISGEKLLRPNSVFVSDGRFGSFLVLMWVLGLGSLGYLLPRARRQRKYILLGVILIAGAILLSGARGAFVYGLASAFVMVGAFVRWGPAWQRAGLHKLLTAIRWSLLPIAASLLILVYVFPSHVGARWAFYSETLSPESPAFELGKRAWDYPVSELMKAFSSEYWVLGRGTGTASLGVGYVGLLLQKPLPGIGVESGFGSILLELGILGPILWILWSVSLLRSSWNVLRRLHGTDLFPVGFSIFWFAFLLLLPFTYGSLAGYQNYILNSYLWLLVGVLFRLPALAQDDRLNQNRGG